MTQVTQRPRITPRARSPQHRFRPDALRTQPLHQRREPDRRRRIGRVGGVPPRPRPQGVCLSPAGRRQHPDPGRRRGTRRHPAHLDHRRRPNAGRSVRAAGSGAPGVLGRIRAPLGRGAARRLLLQRLRHPCPGHLGTDRGRPDRRHELLLPDALPRAGRDHAGEPARRRSAARLLPDRLHHGRSARAGYRLLPRAVATFQRHHAHWAPTTSSSTTSSAPAATSAPTSRSPRCTGSGGARAR